MKTALSSALAFVLSAFPLFSMPAHAAGGCNVYIREGVVRGNCDFSSVIEKVLVRFDYTPRIFPLPNLRPNNPSYFVSGYNVDVGVEVENVNPIGAFSHDVAVVYALSQTNPSTGISINRPVPRTARVAGVPGGTSVPVRLASIDLSSLGFTRDYDIDVVMMIVVDPVTPARTRGEIIEYDETDNSDTRACRIFGTVIANPGPRQCR